MERIVEVVLSIYGGDNDKQCLFYEENNILYLPHQIIEEEYPADICVKLAKSCLLEDLRLFDIVPCGFFDSKIDTRERNLVLMYKTIVFEHVKINPNLQWMKYEQVREVRPRIRRGHYEAYLTGTMF